MLKITSGDIFKAKTEAIVNTVNTVGIMGKGLALQFKHAYPDMYKEYVKICKAKELYVGRLFIYEPDDDKFKYIINFPTKKHWRDNSKLKDIKVGLEVLVKKIKLLKIKSISVPALGCNNGKLNWDDVMSLMLENLMPLAMNNNIDIYLYKPLD